MAKKGRNLVRGKMCKFLELLCNLENKLFFVEGPAEEGFDEDPEG